MKKRTLVSAAVMTALSSMVSLNSYAFGLGKIEVMSALNEPFKAVIPITALRDDEIGNLQVRLASGSEFERAGLERNYFLTQFQFDVEDDIANPVIKISSKKSVKEPFIDLLLTASAGSGRLIREYTVLLDPPTSIFAKKEVVAKQSVSVSKPTKSVSSVSQPTTTPTSKVTATSYGPTDRNDTLWNVALKTRQEKSISVNQMMMALLEQNPAAFSHNNINGLKQGYTLDIPTISQIESLSKSEANSAVTEQNNLWKNRNNKVVPAPVTTTPVAPEPEKIQAVEIEHDKATTDTTAVVENDATARLKLVAPSDTEITASSEPSPLGSDKVTELSEQLTLAQETIEGQAQENIDLKSRLDMMEEQIETLRRLISLNDPDLARLQDTLEDDSVTEQGSELIEQQLTDEVTQQQAEIIEDVETNIDEVASEQVDNVEQVTEDTQQADVSIADKSNDALQETSAEPVQEDLEIAGIRSVDDVINYTSDLTGVEQEHVDSIIDKVKAVFSPYSKQTLMGTGLAFLLFIWLIIRYRNRPDMTWEEAQAKAAKKKGSSVEEQKNTRVIVDNDSVLDTDEPLVEQPEQSEQADLTVEKMINDADVYVSYGDFSKAKQTLQRANDRFSNNQAVIYKLLFVLYKQAQTQDFIDMAKQYQTETDALNWDDITVWGREIAPEAELFKAVEQTNFESETLTEQVESISAEPEVESLNIGTDNVETEQVETLDLSEELKTFSTDDTADETEPEEPSFEAEAADVETLSLDIDTATDTVDLDESVTDLDTEQDLTVDIDEPVEELTLDINDSADESFELEGLDTVSDEELSQATEALEDSNDLEFDLSDFDQVDEAETKLDLASAYIDMGDPDGAKSILEEVLNEGNDEQKSRAQDLLNQVS